MQISMVWRMCFGNNLELRILTDLNVDFCSAYEICSIFSNVHFTNKQTAHIQLHHMHMEYRTDTNNKPTFRMRCRCSINTRSS